MNILSTSKRRSGFSAILVSVCCLLSTHVFAQNSCESPLSTIGQAVLSALGAEDASSLSYCNTLVALHVESENAFLSDIAREIELTQTSFALASPSYSKSYIEEFLAPALARRNALADGESGDKPLFQFITRMYPAQLYDDLLQGIDPPLNIHIAVYQVSGRDNLSNDAHILIRDHSTVYSGSAELGRPLNNDLNIQLQGEAGTIAHRQLSRMLETASAITCNWRNGRQHSYCRDLPATPQIAPPSPSGSLPVFSLFRGYTGSPAGDDLPVDIALTAALDAAQNSIRLSQPSYAYRESLSDFFYQAIASALLRGVQVESIVGINRPNDLTPEQQFQLLSDYIEAEGMLRGFTESERQQAHCRLRFAVRLNVDGTPAANNAKLMMIDKRSYYIGSQDFTPRSFWRDTNGDSQGMYEHGFFIDNRAAAERLETLYWQPLWTAVGNSILRSPYLADNVQCPAAPLSIDLSPTTIEYPHEPVVFGDSVFFNAGVRNSGSDASGVFNVSWLVNGFIINEPNPHDSVAGNSAVTDGNSDFLWTPEAAGNYSIGFKVDSDDNVSEQDETNNITAITISVESPALDLATNEIIVPAGSFDPGEQITFSTSVSNLGNVDSGEFVVRWRIAETTIAENTIANVGAHDTFSGRATRVRWTAPTNIGFYRMEFEIDPQRQLRETDRTNNYQNAPVQVGSGRAELVARPISRLTENMIVGQPVVFESCVLNAGNFGSAPFRVRWRVNGHESITEGSHNGVPTGDCIIGQAGRFEWIAVPGSHSITYDVDIDNDVNEMDETNNSISLDIQVP